MSGTKFHLIVMPTGNPDDGARGTVFEITQAELAAADRHEISDYKRVSVVLRSGHQA
ncbi:hypothetical protein [Paraburkholderia sp. BCC1885]|uniref:hypothetical protein n=1 Tax=Paraburkholderia sp. BCC1885 TaxID=2562669 RepID=UPI0028CB9AAB|nr:hypothetical protein [Paraburkholderia sp. BCC1885]